MSHPDQLKARAKLLASRGLCEVGIVRALADEGHEVSMVTVRRWLGKSTRWYGYSRDKNVVSDRYYKLREQAPASVSDALLRSRIAAGWPDVRCLQPPKEKPAAG